METIQDNGLKSSEAEVKTDKPRTKEQQRRLDRQVERANEEAQQVFNTLKDQLFRAFMDSPNPEETMPGDTKIVSAKWKTYCKRKNLIASVYDRIDLQGARLMEDYFTMKNGTDENSKPIELTETGAVKTDENADAAQESNNSSPE